MNVHTREALRSISSALRYKKVDNVLSLPNDYYYPNALDPDNVNVNTPIQDIEGLTLEDAGVPFKGLHVENACQLAIIDVDGSITVFNLTAGVWPYGGIGVSVIGSDFNPTVVFLY